MTESEYRAHPAVNKSTLWEMRRSPMHYKHALTTPRPDTTSLAFGRAVHKLILQPNDFDTEFICAPASIDRRTKSGREQWEDFLTTANGREIISHDDYARAQAMASEVRSNPAAAKLIEAAEFEKPLFWRVSGVECKCRCDIIAPGIVADYKTCGDASTDAFTREALRYGYDLQAAMYLNGAAANGYGHCDWYFIAQEKTEPYAVNVIRGGDTFVERGIWRMNSLLERYAECRLTDTWPGYNSGDDANEIILPEWMAIAEED